MVCEDLEKILETERSRYEQCNQQHVLDHFPVLTPIEKLSLLKQLELIEVEKLSGFVSTAKEEVHNQKSCHPNTSVAPFSGKVGSIVVEKDLASTYYRLGIDATRKNTVAALLLAGGQGTRLGFDGPKGMYDIGLTSGKTLFCLIAERIRKLIQLSEANDRIESDNSVGQVRVPLYIMTSPMNDKVTREYFEMNNYFGLPSEDVLFFAQGTLPCLSSSGSILMESPSKCAMAPDGNGGVYSAMERCGIISDMALRGIEHVHAFAIDNALTKPADPAFIGYCIAEKADCGNKVLWKVDPHEKVGVIAEKDGKPCVVEYSIMSKEMAEMVNDDNKLIYGAANVCNHYYTLSFLKDKVLPNLGSMYHVADKKIPIWDEEKVATVTPSVNNGIKLESFIFDVFPLSSSMAILEVDRLHEFAPVKNSPGSETDSPDVARKMISDVAKKWLLEAGSKLTGEVMSNSCEVVPMSSFGGEGLDTYKDKCTACPFSL